MKKNKLLITAVLLSVLVLFTGCSEKSDGDIEVARIFVANEFTGPDVDLKNALDRGPSSPELKKYLEMNYESIVADPEAFYNKNIILMYLSAAHRNEYQLFPRNIDIEKVDSASDEYYYEVEVEYSKDGESKTAAASGRVNINKDGKISIVRNQTRELIHLLN